MTDIPKLKSIGDVFLIEWGKEKVRFKIDRIHEKTEGTTGEVLVTQAEGHLFHARVNLLSPHSKSVMANELAKRVNNLDWQAMIEQAFMKTLIEYRKGEPVIEVGNLPRRTAPRYRLKPFILENQMCALYATGGSGKSLVADLFAVMIQCGVELLGFKVLQGNVLILDWETSEETVDERIKAIKAGMNIESTAIPYYRRCFHILTHDIVEIQKEVIEKDIKLAIIDSAGMAAGFGSDFHTPAIEMLRALRSLKVAELIIDHKPKGGDTMFGSVYKFNECRAAFEIKATQETGSKALDLALFHTKFNDTPKHKPIGFHIEFEGTEDYTDSIIFTRKDVADMAELEINLSYKERIMNCLKQGAMEYKAIAEETGISEHIVRTTISRNKEVFVKTEYGWGLLSKYV
jgi:uncharacterized protein YerC